MHLLYMNFEYHIAISVHIDLWDVVQQYYLKNCHLRELDHSICQSIKRDNK